MTTASRPLEALSTNVRPGLAAAMKNDFAVGGVHLGMTERDAIAAAKAYMPKAARYSRLVYGREEVGYRDVGFKLSCDDRPACKEGGTLEVYAPQRRVISIEHDWRPRVHDALPTGAGVVQELRNKYPGIVFEPQHRDGEVVGYKANIGFMPGSETPTFECGVSYPAPLSPCSTGFSVDVLGDTDVNSVLRVSSIYVRLVDIAANTKFNAAEARANEERATKPRL